MELNQPIPPTAKEQDLWNWLTPRQKFYVQLLAEMKTLNTTLQGIAISQESIAESSRKQVDLLKRWIGAPNPGPLTLIVKEEPMPGTLIFDVQLPTWPGPEGDVASAELSVAVDGGAPTVTPVAKDTPKVVGLQAPQNSSVALSFAYIDDAGNRSATPSTLTQVITDTLPPADPGALGIAVTGEV